MLPPLILERPPLGFDPNDKNKLDQMDTQNVIGYLYFLLYEEAQQPQEVQQPKLWDYTYLCMALTNYHQKYSDEQRARFTTNDLYEICQRIFSLFPNLSDLHDLILQHVSSKYLPASIISIITEVNTYHNQFQKKIEINIPKIRIPDDISAEEMADAIYLRYCNYISVVVEVVINQPITAKHFAVLERLAAILLNAKFVLDAKFLEPYISANNALNYVSNDLNRSICFVSENPFSNKAVIDHLYSTIKRITAAAFSQQMEFKESLFAKIARLNGANKRKADQVEYGTSGPSGPPKFDPKYRSF